MPFSPDRWTYTRITGGAKATLAEAVFGGIWCVAGASSMNRPYSVVAPSLAMVVTLALLVPAVRLLRAAPSGVEGQPDRERDAARKRRALKWIVLLEGAAILVVIRLIARAGLQAYIPSAVAMVVGIHFFPLARVFETPMHFVTAFLLTGAGLVVMVGLGTAGPDLPATTWNAALDFFSAMVLWCSAAAILARAWSARRSADLQTFR